MLLRGKGWIYQFGDYLLILWGNFFSVKAEPIPSSNVRWRSKLTLNSLAGRLRHREELPWIAVIGLPSSHSSGPFGYLTSEGFGAARQLATPYEIEKSKSPGGNLARLDKLAAAPQDEAVTEHNHQTYDG